MDINIRVKLESPELMASILALAESLTQMKLGVVAQGQIGQAIVNKGSERAEIMMETTVKTQEEMDGAKSVTIEELRAKLTALIQAGKEEEVRLLLKKFGGEKLTEISKERYWEVLREAERLN